MSDLSDVISKEKTLKLIEKLFNSLSSREYSQNTARNVLNSLYTTIRDESVDLSIEDDSKYKKILDNCIDTNNCTICWAIAKQGYGLERFIDSPYFYIRAEVARQGYGLDKLINDEDWCVRIEVARQGYGLDKLANDKHPKVRKVAIEKLNSINESIVQKQES